MKQDNSKAIAAFLANGGKVKKIAIGKNSGISDRDFYLAEKGVKSLKPQKSDVESAAQDFDHTRDHAAANDLRAFGRKS